MDGNFSERVQEVIRLSREEALRLGHDYIGTEHILLGIIRESQGIAITIMKNLNVDLLKLKKSIEDSVKATGGTLTIGNIPLTKQAEKVLKITQIEAKIYKSSVIGTEHILLSLLRDEENIATQILHQFQVTYEAARSELSYIMSNQPVEDRQEQRAFDRILYSSVPKEPLKRVNYGIRSTGELPFNFITSLSYWEGVYFFRGRWAIREPDLDEPVEVIAARHILEGLEKM